MNASYTFIYIQICSYKFIQKTSPINNGRVIEINVVILHLPTHKLDLNLVILYLPTHKLDLNLVIFHLPTHKLDLNSTLCSLTAISWASNIT
jgi:hypothetical protein